MCRPARTLLLLALVIAAPARAAGHLVNVGDNLRKVAHGADRLEVLVGEPRSGWPVLALVETAKPAIEEFLEAIQTVAVRAPREDAAIGTLCECPDNIRFHRGSEVISMYYDGTELSSNDGRIGTGFVDLTPLSKQAITNWFRARLGDDFAPRQARARGLSRFLADLPWQVIPPPPDPPDAEPPVPPGPNPLITALPDERTRLHTVLRALGAFGWDEPQPSAWTAVAFESLEPLPPAKVAAALLGSLAGTRGAATLLFGPWPATLVPWAERLPAKSTQAFLRAVEHPRRDDGIPCAPLTRLRALHGVAPAQRGTPPCAGLPDALPELQWAVARADAGLAVPKSLLTHAHERLTLPVDRATARVAEAIARGDWPAGTDLSALDPRTIERLLARRAKAPSREGIDQAMDLLLDASGALRAPTLAWLSKVSGLPLTERNDVAAIRAWWRTHREEWQGSPLPQ